MLLNELFEDNFPSCQKNILYSSHTTTAGVALMSLEEEQIIQAAFRIPETGKVYPSGPNHDVSRLPDDVEFDFNTLESGFLTDTGKFLDRKSAAKLTHLKKTSAKKGKLLHSFNIKGLGTDRDRQLFNPEQVSPVLR
jgi:hypothetical protein